MYALRIFLFSVLFVMASCDDEPSDHNLVCEPACSADQDCVDGVCVPRVCDPACLQGQHCEGVNCMDNVCSPPCGEGELCVTHDATECLCVNPPCGDPPTPCSDGLDNDGDGWIDGNDPDCATGGEEIGLGTTGCNDGLDNDGDGFIDDQDPECTAATGDELLGAGPCVDECLMGSQESGRVCRLWDAATMAWVDTVETGDGHMHNRSRDYSSWLRSRLMPEGGVMRAWFTDDTYTQVAGYGGTRDSPIWTGTFLAAEALRYMTTGSPDAAAQLDTLVRTMDRWWRISGDQGYLARYAALASSAAPVLAIFDAANPENHLNVSFEGNTWHWKGNVSRDQYQGTMLGHSFAYEATDDEALKELIRANVVTFVERLMTFETRAVDFVIDGIAVPWSTELGHCVYTDDETTNGKPRIEISTSPFELTTAGLLIFWPDPMEFLGGVPLLGSLPPIYFRSQAIQLGSMFAVALQVTEGVPSYAARRAAILAHYEERVEDWVGWATEWSDTNTCGSSYHGFNIAFEPAWNWVRLETDPVRKDRLQTAFLRDAMWPEVADHKNVFFALIYASQAAASDNTAPIISSHLDQLRLFPQAPNTAHPVDNTAEYTEDPSCSGLSATAIDVDKRVPSTFMWERNPWTLTDPGTPNFLYSGVDYLIAYWMARYYGYLADDSPNQCLRWDTIQ